MRRPYHTTGHSTKLTLRLLLLLCLCTAAFAVGARAAHITAESGACLYAVQEKHSAQKTTATAPAFAAPCNVAPDVIGGVAYRDWNFNGERGDLEPGQAGIEVYLFTCDAAGLSQEAAGSVVTDANGEYVFTGLDPAQSYRVEFAIPEDLDFLGFTTFGSDNGTDVQFTVPGTCDISVGVGQEAEFHQDNPFLATPCYINGSGEEGTEGGDSLAFLAVEYNAQGENQNINLFTASEVGSLWGVAYQRATKTIFSAAVLRRHMGFGPGGTGAIYMMDVEDINNPSIIDIIDLDALGFDTGTDPRIADPLPGEFDEPNHDTEAFALTAKMSLGDIDISDDGKTLYTVNLLTRELITIDISDYLMNGTTPTAANVTSTPIPAFNCTIEDDWRPWGLKFKNGNLYLGGVCSAQTTETVTDLTATVVEFDGTTFTEFYSLPLDFQRGDPFNQDNDPENFRNQWFPWSDDYTVIRTDEVNGRFAYPQPILSDIEFDIDGSMILGFLDRTSQQGGYLNYAPNEDDETLYSTFSGGDIIRICNIDGAFVAEGEVDACTNPIGQMWPQGPNGQEYYWEDQYPENPTGNRDRFVIHNEIALGALALLPGSGDVVSTVFDPLLDINSGGIAWFDNTVGNRDRDYQVFATEGGEGVGFPGKSNGLGDLELICIQAPSEIGNYVWVDCNADGIQDPCEDPLPGVNVSLFREDGTLLATVTTDAAGQYYFNDAVIAASSTSPDMMLETATTYYIVFGTDGQYDTGSEMLVLDGTSYTLTADNTGQAPNNDKNDSDPVTEGNPAFTQGLPTAVYTTPCVGTVNHTVDAGFFTGSLDVDIDVTDASCPDATDGSITVTATSDTGAEVEISFNGGPFGTQNVFGDLAPGTFTVAVQTVGGGGGGECGGTFVTEVTIGAGDNPAAPATMDFVICQGEMTPPGQGLMAMCEACTAADGVMTPAVVTWYDAPMGGNLVFTGDKYDPTANGQVDENVVGDYTFYAQCECGPCVSDRTPAVFSVVANPMPEIVGDSLLCPDATATFTVQPLNPGHIFTWEVMGDGIEIVGPTTGSTVTVQATGAAGSGPFQLKVTETGPPGTDCTGMDILDIFIKEVSLVCNDNVQVSLNEDGCFTVTPDVILEGISGTGIGCYDVSITTGLGQDLGDKVTCENIGQTLIVNVASVCEDNSCWGIIEVEDKLGPTLDCSNTEATVILDCTEDPAEVPGPTATDNCSEVTVAQISEEIDDSDICEGVIITRVFTATDAMGNTSSQTCEQTIIIEQPDLPLFPEDIAWQCDQYERFPNITDVAPLREYITDNDLSTEIIDVPFFLSADKLAATGSGLVDVAEGLYCNYAVSSEDDTLEICTGLKIIRTWTLLNWCTGQVVLEDENGNDNVQVIKVTDSQAPLIEAENFIVDANVPSQHPADCASTGMIPIPALYDNCGSITLSIFTPVGEAVYVNGSNANDGASIPAPGLPAGEHTVTYVAADDCENITETDVIVTVTDRIEPNAICDEFTEVTLNSAGLATVQAISFDDGSSDNCCIEGYEVKRLSEPDTAYDSEITFGCTEAGSSVLVMMKVEDCYGNESSCTVSANIDDKQSPTCIAPADITLTCTELANLELDYTDLENLAVIFGAPTATDNCTVEVLENDPTVDVSSCGNGTIVRNFLAADNGDSPDDACQQTIFVEYEANFQLTFPADFEGSCGEVPEMTDVIIDSLGCDLVAINHSDQIFNLSDDGACYKIIRTYEVINWCSFTPGDTPVIFNDSRTPQAGETIDETTFPEATIIQYKQTLKITDDIAPVLSYSGETEFCSDDNCETGSMTIPIDIDENCTSDLDISWVLDEDSDGTIDATGTGQFNATTTMGNHSLLYTVEDGCGNAASYQILFTVLDCKAPVAYCSSGIIIDLMDTNPPMVQIWASDLDAGSFDNCGGEVTFAFSENPLDTGLILTCQDVINNGADVFIYVFDESGNFDYCATQVIVQDNLITSLGMPCIAPDNPVIAGTLTTEAGEGLEGATVELNGGGIAPVVTDDDGVFAFANAETDYDYSVTAQHDIDHVNGVTVFDLTLIKSHILSINPLSSPYKMIAADANNSQSITTADIVQLRRLILTLDTELSANTSWRFVDANYVFPNPQNPWEGGFPEVLNINDFAESVNDADFIAVKIGDVNGTADANLAGIGEERTGDRTLFLQTDNAEFRKEETFTVALRAQDYRNISGMQFTLNFDPQTAELTEVTPNATTQMSDFGLHRRAEGILTVAHNDDTALDLPDGEVLFTLTFRAETAGTTGDLLRISSDYTQAIAYTGDADAMQLALDFGTAPDAFFLYQNRPNPFTEMTEIPFYLPVAGTATLTVFEVNGKVLKTVRADYPAGNNQISIRRSELGSGSIFYYRLETESGSATRKMVVL